MVVIQMKTISRTLFTLNKRGVIEFVFSKLAFLIFGILIVSVFFYFIEVQKQFHNLDKSMRNAEEIINVVGIVQSSPFNISINYNTDFEGILKIKNQSVEFLDGNIVKTSFYLPTNYFDNITVNNCLSIEKNESVVVILNCQ